MYALLALLFALPAKANLVSYVDDAGTRHFVQSEAEVPEKYRKTMKESHAGRASASSPAPAAPAAAPVAGPAPAAAAGSRGAEPVGAAGAFTPPPGVSLPAGINLKDLPAPPPDMNLPGE